uniref:INCENP_ARK-bind domain-containing protein n=1 Tax=Panagrellus redivivus TaxID=6233 RepID=A0A7E4VYY6_PANRE
MGPDLAGSDFGLTLLLPFIIIPVLGGLLFTFSCGKGRQVPVKPSPGVASHKAPKKSVREGGSNREINGNGDAGLPEDDAADNSKRQQLSKKERLSRSQRLKRLFSAKKREQLKQSDSKSVTKFEKVNPPKLEDQADVILPEEPEASQTKVLGARAEEEEEPPPFEAAFAAANDETAHPAANPETPDGTGAAGGAAAPVENKPVQPKKPQMPGSELDVRMSDAAASEKAGANRNLMPVQLVEPVSPAATPSPAVTPAGGADDDSDSDKSAKKSLKKHKKKKHSKKKKKHKRAKPTPNVATAVVPLPPLDNVTRYENLYPQVICKPASKEVTGIGTTVTEDKMIEMTQEQFLTGVNPKKMAEFLQKRPTVMYTGVEEEEPSESKFKNNGVSSKFVGLPKTVKALPPPARSPSPKQPSFDPTQTPGTGELAPTQYSVVKAPTDGTQGTAVSCFDKTQASTPLTRQDTTAPTQGGTTIPSQGVDGTQPDRRTTLGTTQKTDTNIEATQLSSRKTRTRTAATQPDTIVGTPIGSRDAPTQKTRATTVNPTQAGTTMDPTQNTSLHLDGTQIPEGSIEQCIVLPKTHMDPTQVISFNAGTNPTQGSHPTMDVTQIRSNPTLELAMTQKSNSVRKTLPSGQIDKTQNGTVPTFDATQTLHSQKGTIWANTGLTTKAKTRSMADPTQPDPTTTSADTDTVAAVKEIGPTMKSSFVHSFPEGTTQPTIPNSIPSLTATQWGQTVLPTTQPTNTANTAEAMLAKGLANYDKVEKKTSESGGEMATATRITLTETGYPKPQSIPKTPKEVDSASKKSSKPKLKIQKRIAEEHIKSKATADSPAVTPTAQTPPTPVHPDTVNLRQLEEEDERKHMDRRRNLVAKKKADEDKRRRELEDAERDRKRKQEEDRVAKLRANAPKPRTFARNTYEDKIAAGKIVRRKHDYPTMNDIKSDWDSTDTDTAPKDKNGEK